MIKYIRLFSDLHCEFKDYTIDRLPTDEESVLVLAGDINVGIGAIDLIERVQYQFPAIIYVLGNHEYYKRNFQTVASDLQHLLDAYGIRNVWIVDKPRLIELDGYRFACGTLWTDFNNDDPMSHIAVLNGLWDYQVINNGDRRLTTVDTLKLFRETIEKFKEWVDENTIVITHHMPAEACVHERFAVPSNWNLNAGFRSNLEDLIAELKPKLWLCGHGHNSLDTMVHQTRIVMNPRGYPRNHIGEIENFDFKDELVIDLDR